MGCRVHNLDHADHTRAILSAASTFRVLLVVAVVLGLMACETATARELNIWQDSEGSRLSLDGWILADLRAFPRTEAGYGTSWNVEPLLTSARLGVRYQMGQNWGLRLDGEFAASSPDVQEAWFEYREFSWLKVRAGRIKVPFGLAPQRNVIDFPLLSAPMTFGNPKSFRDVGFMLLGDWEDGFVSYQLAAVSGSRDIAVDVNDKPDFVGRLRLHPPQDSSPWINGLGAGVSGSWGLGPTRQGFRGRTLGDYTFMNPPTIRGAQVRLGAEFVWDTPAFVIMAEYARSTQERDGVTESQKVGSTYAQVGDLDSYTAQGWYVEGTLRLSYLLFTNDAQFPGIELSARYERLTFGDGDRTVTTEEGVEQHAPLTDSGLHGVTAGINVWCTRNIRLDVAWQGLRFDDSRLAPDAPEATGTTDAASAGTTPTRSSWVHQVFFRASFTL